MHQGEKYEDANVEVGVEDISPEKVSNEKGSLQNVTTGEPSSTRLTLPEDNPPIKDLKIMSSHR